MGLKNKNKAEKHNKSMKQLRARIYRFNASGLAVRRDDLMHLAGDIVKVRGKGQWKKWTPEAVQRVAFGQGSMRQIVQGLETAHGPTSHGKHAHSMVHHCKMFVARSIDKGQQAACR